MPIVDLIGEHAHIYSSVLDPVADEEVDILIPALSAPKGFTGDNPYANDLAAQIRAKFGIVTTGNVAYNHINLLNDSANIIGSPANHMVLVGGCINNPVVGALGLEPLYPQAANIVSPLVESIADPYPEARGFKVPTSLGIERVRFEVGEGLFGPEATKVIIEGPKPVTLYEEFFNGNFHFRGIIGRNVSGARTVTWVAGSNIIGTRGALIALANSGSFLQLAGTELAIVTVVQMSPDYDPNIPIGQIAITRIEDF